MIFQTKINAEYMPYHLRGSYQTTRQVEVDDELVEQAGEDINCILNLIFVNGQNDFQPQMVPSLSVGDTITLQDNRVFRINNFGFEEVK